MFADTYTPSLKVMDTSLPSVTTVDMTWTTGLAVHLPDDRVPQVRSLASPNDSCRGVPRRQALLCKQPSPSSGRTEQVSLYDAVWRVPIHVV